MEETDAEGRRGRMKFDGEGLKGKTDAGQQKGEDDKSSLVWGCGQMGDSLSFWCGGGGFFSSSV